MMKMTTTSGCALSMWFKVDNLSSLAQLAKPHAGFETKSDVPLP
jgi:hypothetical protein